MMPWYWVLVCVSGSFCLGMLVMAALTGRARDPHDEGWAPRG